MDRIEEVKKKLESKMALEQCDPDVMPYFTDYYWIPADYVMELAQQICQLFEPQPDESRLLNREERRVVFNRNVRTGEEFEKELLEEQRNLTASIKEAECQERIKGIFEEIEKSSYLDPQTGYMWIYPATWQSLKDKAFGGKE